MPTAPGQNTRPDDAGRRNFVKINLQIGRRINFCVLGGEGSHSGAMATDDNNAHGNLDKPYCKFILEEFLWLLPLFADSIYHKYLLFGK